MVESEKFALAARLYVLVKRKTGRSIDAAHVINNKDYAKEVISTAREAHDPDLDALLDRFEKELFGKIAPRAAAAPAAAAGDTPKDDPPSGKYVGMLR
jgi:hypothetical protein